MFIAVVGKNNKEREIRMHEIVDWNEFSENGLLRAVIDPKDASGYKNILIDRIHWVSLKDAISGSNTLLDFGCGTGRFARRINRSGMGYTGVDLSEGMIKAAKKHNPDFEENFYQIDGITLPFADNTFDVCITTYVLQHFLKTECTRVFSEISRVVTPDGIFVSIEQASLCGKSSDTVDQSASEADYIDKLSFFGNDISLNRIRNSSFTPVSMAALRFAPFLPFKLIVGLLSNLEIKTVANFDNEILAKSTYYDVLMKVRRNGK
jgi:SAM-dependent methyltransferase